MKAARTSLARAIKHPAKVTKLDLNNAHLPEFPVEVLALKKLTSLGMFRAIEPKIARSGMSIVAHVIPPEIGSLKGLTRLELGGLCMRTLPESIGSLGKLQKLSLNYCEQLVQLPKSLGKLKSLLELELGDTALKELPASIGDLKNLRSLNVSSIKKLPDSITKLTKLRALHLPRELEKLPKGFGKLAALEELSVSLPALRAIASELHKLTKLRELRISFGDEEGGLELPDELSALVGLRVLKAAFLNLTTLPASLVDLHELVELDVAGNQLKSLAPLVARLPKLKQLSFSENALGRGEKKQLDAMMRVAPSKRATMAGAPVAQSGKDQPHPTFLGQATSINSSIMLMVGDASIAARWRGTDNATSGDTDGSDWDTAFKAKWKGGGAKMCVTVPFSGGELQNLDVGGMGGMVEVFRVGEHLVLVEGVFEEHERKHADFLAYVAEPPAKKAKNTSSVTIKSGVIAFVPAPSSGERITKNLGKLNANGSREFDTESESAVIAKLAKGTYEIWREPEVERSWGEAARVIVKR